MNEAQLVGAIKAHIARGDKAAEKSEGHYIAAGQYLKQLKAEHSGSWEQWETLLSVGIGRSRASELMQIADGRKTAEEVRAITAGRTRRSRENSPLRSGEARGAGQNWVCRACDARAHKGCDCENAIAQPLLRYTLTVDPREPIERLLAAIKATIERDNKLGVIDKRRLPLAIAKRRG